MSSNLRRRVIEAVLKSKLLLARALRSQFQVNVMTQFFKATLRISSKCVLLYDAMNEEPLSPSQFSGTVDEEESELLCRGISQHGIVSPPETTAAL